MEGVAEAGGVRAYAVCWILVAFEFCPVAVRWRVDIIGDSYSLRVNLAACLGRMYLCWELPAFFQCIGKDAW